MTGPTSDRKQEGLTINVVLLGVALLFLAGAVSLPNQARIVPLVVLIPLVPLIGIALRRTLKTTPSLEAPSMPSTSTSELQLLAWILALPALVTTAGMIAGAALFVTLWLKRRSGERWDVSIAAGLVAAGVLWILGATVLAGLPSGGLLLSLAALR